MSGDDINVHCEYIRILFNFYSDFSGIITFICFRNLNNIESYNPSGMYYKYVYSDFSGINLFVK